MYNTASIEALKHRVGWFPPLEPTDLVITFENELSESGLFVNSFHSLATVEKVWSSLDNVNADQEVLNEILAKIKVDAANDVLLKVYNLNTRATARFTNFVESLNYSLDYTDSILLNAQSFNEVIGLSMAIKVVETLRLTTRSNRDTNSFKINDMVYFEALNGLYNEYGKSVSKGLYAQYREAIAKLIDVLFPVRYPDGDITIDPDGGISVDIKQRPVIRSLRVW